MEITKAKKGFTLIEVIVAMTIFSVAVLLVVDIYIELSRFYLGSLSNRTAQQNLKIAIETITRYAKQSTEAEWDAGNKTLKLSILDDAGNRSYVVFRNDAVGASSVMKMGLEENNPNVVANQNLTSEGLFIEDFSIKYHPGVPAIIDITLSARVEETDRNLERGASGANEVTLKSAVALKNQYNY